MCAHGERNRELVRVDSNKFVLLTHSNDPHCTLGVKKSYGLAQAMCAQDWQPICFFVGEVCTRHAVSGAKVFPLAQIEYTLCISELHPAIDIFLES